MPEIASRTCSKATVLTWAAERQLSSITLGRVGSFLEPLRLCWARLSGTSRSSWGQAGRSRSTVAGTSTRLSRTSCGDDTTGDWIRCLRSGSPRPRTRMNLRRRMRSSLQRRRNTCQLPMPTREGLRPCGLSSSTGQVGCGLRLEVVLGRVFGKGIRDLGHLVPA